MIGGYTPSSPMIHREEDEFREVMWSIARSCARAYGTTLDLTDVEERIGAIAARVPYSRTTVAMAIHREVLHRLIFLGNRTLDSVLAEYEHAYGVTR